MFSPTQRVRAKANFLRFGTVEAHIGDDPHVVWDGTEQSVRINPDDVEPATREDEAKAREGTMRFLKAIRGET